MDTEVIKITLNKLNDIIEQQTERIKKIEDENWWLKEYKKYVAYEINRGSIPMEFQVWNQAVDKLAKELKQVVSTPENKRERHS